MEEARARTPLSRIKGAGLHQGGELLRHAAWLRDRLDATSPGDFRAGVMLHTGQQHLTVGDRLYLRPMQSPWATSPTGSPDR